MAEPLFYHDVFRTLVDAKVRFVVVGGVAVNLQGVPRFTADIDVAVATDSANLLAAGAALTGLGLTPRLPVPVAQLGEPERVREWIEERNLQAFTFQDPKNALRTVDLLLVIPFPFEELQRGADRLSSAGLEIPVASIEALIRMKEKTGREQDASDVDALKRILEMEKDDG